MSNRPVFYRRGLVRFRKRVVVGVGVVVVIVSILANWATLSQIGGGGNFPVYCGSFGSGAPCQRVGLAGYSSYSIFAPTHPPPVLSVVVVMSRTQSPQQLEGLLRSIAMQQIEFIVEVVVAEMECQQTTQRMVNVLFPKLIFLQDAKKTYIYAPLCNTNGNDNTRQTMSETAAGRNRVVLNDWVHPQSPWILFLNDDLLLSSNFLEAMMELVRNRPLAGAVGCLILNEQGTEVLEAGSIVWADATEFHYGTGPVSSQPPDLQMSRPTDRVSGDCLMVQSTIFKNYGGFQSHISPQHHEDLDLQLHIQHDLDKQVWIQPLARANKKSNTRSPLRHAFLPEKKGANAISTKWQTILHKEHAMPPPTRIPEILHMIVDRAKDIRLRQKSKITILYINEHMPNPSHGFDRAYDTIKMIADMGHYVTVIALKDPPNGCPDKNCISNLETTFGVEVVRSSTVTLAALMLPRIGFYDIVIVSKPSTLLSCYKTLQEFYKYSPFLLVYDNEALGFRWDESFLSSTQDVSHHAPSTPAMNSTPEIIQQSISIVKDFELELLGMADVIVSVSDRATKMVHELNDCNPKESKELQQGERNCTFASAMHTIGFLMDSINPTTQSFEDRKGILYVADFHERIYHHGDALWHFVHFIYPGIIVKSAGTIPLTISGRNIPTLLRNSVKRNLNLSQHVTFLESPPNLKSLYQGHRLFLLPHLYGTRSLYELSEALALGVPAVISTSVAENYGISSWDEIACIGEDLTSFHNCVLALHSDQRTWKKFRTNSIEFVQRMYNRDNLLSSISEIIKVATVLSRALPKCDPELDFIACVRTTEAQGICPVGEEAYLLSYPDVYEAVEARLFSSAWQHFIEFGKMEGRFYSCCPRRCENARDMCPQGEKTYNELYPDVAHAVDVGIIPSAWYHFIRFGRDDGRTYSCCRPKNCDFNENARLLTSNPLSRLDKVCQQMHHLEKEGGLEVILSLDLIKDIYKSYCIQKVSP